MLDPFFQLRPATKDDVPFVSHTFLTHYQNSPEAADLGAAYRRTILPVITECLKHDMTVVCNAEDETQLFACMVSWRWEGVPVLDWVYCKSGWRRMGLCRALLTQALGDSRVYVMTSPPYGSAIKRLESLNDSLGVKATVNKNLRAT